MTIEIYANSFEGIRQHAAKCFGRLEKAKDYKDVKSMSELGGGGSGGSEPIRLAGYSATLKCPVEAEIAELRRRADELEKTLDAGVAGSTVREC